ncbi:MAG: hypothetical protein ACKOYC_04685, partial [Bacteroidota bacterium]
QQSGVVDLKIADIVKDGSILELSRTAAVDLLKQDPTLSKQENAPAIYVMEERMKGREDWSKVS